MVKQHTPSSDAANAPNPIAGMSFEAALKELESIVERFESGNVSLDDAVAAYARGTELKDHCQRRLDEAKMRVEAIRTKTNQGGHNKTANKNLGKNLGIDGTAPLDTTSGE